MDSGQRQTFNVLLRAHDTQGVVALLGADYDFAIDAADVVQSATWYGDIALLQYALDRGGNVSKEDGLGYPLANAASAGRRDMVALLLERGAPINAVNTHGGTALSRAAGNGRLSVVKVLLKAGANPAGALYAAARAARAPMVKFLIAAGAPLDEVSDDGFRMTPLLAACSVGKKKGSEVARLLLSAGADATYVRQSDGMSALMFAQWGQCSEDVLAELRAHGAPEPDAHFPLIQLV